MRPCLKAEFILKRKAFFHHFLTCAFLFLRGWASIQQIDIKNATPRAMLLHELKKVQLQERFMLMTHDSIGRLKMLCMSIYR